MIRDEHVITGAAWEELSEEERMAALTHYQVFVGCNTQQKTALVRALKAAGYVVAYSGDRICDVVPLKEAHVGIVLSHVSYVLSYPMYRSWRLQQIM